MASDKHTHTIHIDAPVETVFRYAEDPANFVAAMPERNAPRWALFTGRRTAP